MGKEVDRSKIFAISYLFLQEGWKLPLSLRNRVSESVTVASWRRWPSKPDYWRTGNTKRTLDLWWIWTRFVVIFQSYSDGDIQSRATGGLGTRSVLWTSDEYGRGLYWYFSHIVMVTFKADLLADWEHEAYFEPLMNMDEVCSDISVISWWWPSKPGYWRTGNTKRSLDLWWIWMRYVHCLFLAALIKETYVML